MTSAGGDVEQPAVAHRRPGVALFWISAAAGWAVIGYGVRCALHHHGDTRPASLARFVVGAALVHDLIVAPAVVLLGTLVRVVVRDRWKSAVQAAMIVSGTLAVFSYPLVRGFAHRLNNPSSLPHNYTANLVAVLAGVWGVTALLVAQRARSQRRGDNHPGQETGTKSLDTLVDNGLDI